MVEQKAQSHTPEVDFSSSCTVYQLCEVGHFTECFWALISWARVLGASTGIL